MAFSGSSFEKFVEMEPILSDLYYDENGPTATLTYATIDYTELAVSIAKSNGSYPQDFSATWHLLVPQI